MQTTIQWMAATGRKAGKALQEALGRVAGLSVTPPVARSDHDAVWLTLSEPHPPQGRPSSTGRRALRYPLLPEEIDLVRSVAERSIAGLQASLSPQGARPRAVQWDSFKPDTKKETMRQLRARRRRIVRSYRQRKRRLRAALRAAQTANADVLGAVADITRAMAELSLDRYARWKEVRDQLVAASEDHSLYARRRMFSQYAGNGAAAIRALYRRIALRHHGPAPARLPPEGDGPWDPSKRLAKDWRQITQRAGLDSQLQDRFFEGLPPPRAVVDPQPLVEPFTEDEVATAIAACPQGKASGPDGLPNDWYRDHADLLVPVLTTLFNEWYAEGALPASFGTATIYCIPKKPNPRTGLDYRPIALLNTDYKIFARLLLARTSPQLHKLVAPSQFGFVPGRQVHDAIDVWTALTRLVERGDAPASATAILLDFAKAYDTLDRRFLTLALRRLQFPDQFVTAVEAMHLATTALTSRTASYPQKSRFSTAFLAAAPGISGVVLPTGDVVTTAGFADDTTVYLADPAEAACLRAELDGFARVSGLAVNVDKCQAVALSSRGWSSESGDVGFPKLDADQTARLLGSQVGSRVNPAFVWDLAIRQIRSRLAVAQVKTSDVVQRAQIAQAIIVPKLLFVGRHCWPSASRIRDLQRLMHNYVWHGRFVAAWSGRAWMNTEAASLPRRSGGLSVPDLHAAFLQLATATHIRWSERGSGLPSAVGLILGSSTRGTLFPVRPCRSPETAPRLMPTLASTGLAFATILAAQQRTTAEQQSSRELLACVGHGTSQTRWWGGDWYFADYSADRSKLLALRQHQTDMHGSFDFHALMCSRVCGDDILHDANGQPVGPRDFPALVRADARIGDLVEIQWVRPCVARFRCRTLAFPLPPTAVRSFRRLCDTIVYNYPGVLAPHDPADVVRVSPATIDSWRLRATPDSGFHLIWEPSNGLQVDLGEVRSMRAVTGKVRHALSDPTARALDHAWLTPTRAIWTRKHDPLGKNVIKTRARAAKTTRGHREVRARAERLAQEDLDIGAALDSIKWTDIDRLRATTSAQRLRLRRIKGNRLSGWDCLHEKHGCPHCVDACDGGRISHIFWECDAAQSLWQVLLDGWAGLNVWDTDQPTHTQLKHAAFSLQVPRTPSSVWHLPALATLRPQDADSFDRVHEAVEVAWQQQVLEVFGVIWKWRHNVDGGAQQWSRENAVSYLRTTLHSATRGLLDRLRPFPALRDPRRQVLQLLAAGYDTAGEPPAPPAADACDDRHVLFFDGGSRGNPGPGGAGAVLVTTDRDGMRPRVVWSACMSLSRPATTNNQAEYHGIIAGLQEAYTRRWTVDVVGDSQLILGQLAHYRPPRNAALRPLYSRARRLADLVRVNVWQHHLRAYNKMADAAANFAMDARASSQVSHPSGRPHTALIDAHLASDIQEWRARRLLRLAQD